jgi:Nucleotidyl transferase AbiEii toxin, Type IV TA system
MHKPRRNIAASVRRRLLDLSRERNQPFELMLTRYVLERLLYRLSITEYRQSFILKGAMLMTAWLDQPLRPTRDIDLLGFVDSDPQAIVEIFREICVVECDDGVIFDAGALEIDFIRDEQEYGGLRIKTNATLDGARVRVVVDIGFGDAVEPGIVESELPVLLDLPAPRLRTYAPETLIAEKFQAMVVLGRANSRMKDFHDIWTLSRIYDFSHDGLDRAIAATFARRKTPIPIEPPDALTPAFAADPSKQQQWMAFLRGIAADAVPIPDIIDGLREFVMPHARRAQQIAEKASHQK